MKRLIALTLLVCLLLISGCGKPATDNTESTGGQTTGSVTEQTTEATTEETTEAPTICPTKATLYLLEKAAFYDSGYVVYHYDENYNIMSYDCYSIENELLFTGYFEQPDTNGMPGEVRLQWKSGDTYSNILKFHQDGKLESVMEKNSNYSGVQYEYNEKGDRSEIREYYEGILQSTVIYQYENGLLKSIHCEDPEGNLIYDTRLENGVIAEKIYDEGEDAYRYSFKYDELGYLTERYFELDGELLPEAEYSYREVEVEYDRLWYLLEQQKYLFDHT